jgi:hypothetical protein
MNFNLTVTNNEADPVDIRDLELVYFYTPDTAAGATFQTYFGAGTTPVITSESISGGPAGATDYISVTFDTSCPGGCSIAGNGGSIGGIQFGVFSSPNDGRYDMTNDYSFTAGASACPNMVIRLGDVIVYGTPPAGLPANW